MEHLPQPPKYQTPVHDEEEPPIVIDPPQRVSPQRVYDQRFFESLVDDSRGVFDWLDEQLGSESYGAPRVFDLYTLLAVTLAFALLFAFLRLLEPAFETDLANVAIAIGFFSTLIAIAQLALWDGKKPRLASVVAGPPIWMLISAGFLVATPHRLLEVSSWLGLFCSSVLGFPAGYLGGAMVAGVFLLADMFRQRFMSSEARAAESRQREATWDEIVGAESTDPISPDAPESINICTQDDVRFGGDSDQGAEEKA